MGIICTKPNKIIKCNLCNNLFDKSHTLYNVCNTSSCSICYDCFYNQYKNIKFGSIVHNKSEITCPICRKLPIKEKVLIYSNYSWFRDFSNITNLFINDVVEINEWEEEKIDNFTLNEWDNKYIYIICRKCNMIKKSCNKSEIPDDIKINNNECNTCKKIIDYKKIVCKKCPECKTLTFKEIGCEHITCTICNIHWCWTCCKKLSSDKDYIINYDLIYEHIRNCIEY